MRAFFDNDIIHKLAAFGLLAEALTALGLRPLDVFVLPTARVRFQVGKPEVASRKYGAEVAERIRSFLGSVDTVAESPHPDDERAVAGVLGIDAGEAILLSVVSRTPDSLLVTGDKRCLVALALAPSCMDICSRIQGRVLCLEQVLLSVITVLGVDRVRAGVVPAVTSDTAIRAVFGSGIEALESGVSAGLSSYIEDLRRQAGGLLRP